MTDQADEFDTIYQQAERQRQAAIASEIDQAWSEHASGNGYQMDADGDGDDPLVLARKRRMRRFERRGGR